MKQVKKYISRVSLAVFAIGASYTLVNVEQFNEVSSFESRGEMIAQLVLMILC